MKIKADLRQGDCLELMPSIPAGSVDMVLVDPPYGTMQGANLDGWENRTTEWDIAITPAKLFAECERIMRENAALVIFSQEPYTSKLITEAHNNLPFSYRMAWVKDHFANALVAKKAPVSYFEDVLVFFKKYDTQGLHPLRQYARMVLEHCGGNLKKVNQIVGHRRAEHFFYVDSTQFGLGTEKTYQELCAVFGIDHQAWFKHYAELVEINRQYERVFNLPAGAKFKSNVLQFKKDYTGHHPTQKPVALLEDLIQTYSRPGDTVLDFTMGSGSTGVACMNAGRHFIGIELDPGYYAAAAERIEQARLAALGIHLLADMPAPVDQARGAA